ncbi:MAG: AAA family ATPase [Acetobacterales bacterium]
MRLRSVRLHNVRRFTDPVQIDGIGDGLSVLCAPNEQGKSTFFDALHALFFKDRKSWDREVRALVPYAGGDPAVAVELELDDASYRLEKRWNRSRSGEVRVWRSGQLFKQSDDAEAWISETFRSPKDGGPAGLLWVRQGPGGLDSDGDAGRTARRDLVSSVAGEVEAMTGGRRMDLAVQYCAEQLARYLTPTDQRERRRNLEPVKQELVPLLRLLWEDAELQFDAEEILPTALVRNGQEETFSSLSGGTQEQIALLVRLAFARILAGAGRPAPVILDDAIVYTDDHRIERMFDALTRQAQDIQILVFSCRQKAFRDLGGQSLAIVPAEQGVQAAQ